MSNQTIKDRIMVGLARQAFFGTPPLQDFIALGPDAIPVVVDIFRNPQDIAVVREFGSDVDVPVLVALLDHYARQGDSTAGHALFVKTEG